MYAVPGENKKDKTKGAVIPAILSHDFGTCATGKVGCQTG